MERDQQSERLQVIEQPALPQDPVKPNRVKFLMIAFALALAAGLGVIIASEALDGSIRHSRELLAVAQGRMIVSIPYIATRAETLRRKGLLAIVLGIIVFAFWPASSGSFSSAHRSICHRLINICAIV